jgi:hypothetical protein
MASILPNTIFQILHIFVRCSVCGEKITKNIYKPIFVKINMYVTAMEKRSPLNLSFSVIIPKLTKVSDCPIGKNLPSLGVDV